jgi:Bacterial Ig-like domain (group 1)/Carboxypeptidase regulatory-like domain
MSRPRKDAKRHHGGLRYATATRVAAVLGCAVPVLFTGIALSGSAAAATNTAAAVTSDSAASSNPVPGDQTTFATAVANCYDTYTVPDQVTQIEVQAVGADGTDGQNNVFDGTAPASFEGAGSGEIGQVQPGGQSGRGSEVDTTLSVFPGEKLYVGPSSIAFGGGVGGLAGMYHQPTSSTDQAAQPGAGGAGGNASFISTSPPSTTNGTCSFSPAQLRNDILVVAAGGGGGGGGGSGEDDVLTNGLRAQDPGGDGGSELGTAAQEGGGSQWQSISTTDPLNQSGDQDEGTAGSNATSAGGGASGSGGFSVSVINDWTNNLGKLFNAGVICIPGSSGGAGSTSAGGAGGAAAQSGLYGNPTDMSSVADLSAFLAAEGESTSSESLGSLSTIASAANLLINYFLSDPNEPTVWVTGCGGEDADPSWSLRPSTSGETQIIPGLSSGGGGGGGGGYYSGGGGGGADDFYINAGGGGGGAGSSYVQGQNAATTAADTSVPSGDAGVTLIPLETPPTITAASPTVHCTIGQFCSDDLDTTGIPVPQVGFSSGNSQLPAGLAFGADTGVNAPAGASEVSGSATDCSSVGTHTYANQIEAINAAGSATLPSLSIDISPGVMQDIRLNTVSGNATGMVAGDTPTTITAFADYPSCSYDVSGSSGGTWSVSGSKGTGGGSVSNSSVVTLAALTGQSASDNQENIVPVGPGTATVNFTYTDPWGQTLTQPETVTVTHGAPQRIWFENGQCTTATDASTGLTLVPGQTGSPKVCADFGNGDIEDVTNLAHWEGVPSGLSVAGVAVSGIGVTAGTPQGIGAGELSETGDVTAYLGAQTAALAVTVNFGSPSSILIQNNAAPAGGLEAGGTEQLTALATYSTYGVYADVTKLANWSSDDTDRALIVHNGNSGGDLTAPSYTLGGQVTVSATLGSATGSYVTQIPVGTPDTLRVSDASGNLGSDTVDLGTSEQLEAIGAVGSDTDNVNAQTTWTSSNPQAVTVTSGGIVAAVGPDYGGPVQIIANDSNVTGTYEVTVGLSHPQIISVKPTNPTVPLGSQVQLTATGFYGSGNYTADITSLVSWSAPSALGTVSSTGMLNTKGTNSQGLSDPVTASLGGVSGQTTITEQGQAPNGITVTASSGTLQLGTSEQLTATANFDDNSTSDVTSTVTWSSDNTNLFTVSPSGVVTAAGATGGAGGGLQANVRATLTYTDSGGHAQAISGTDFLTVSLANPSSITVTPPATDVYGNAGFAFTATGNYPGGHSADLSYVATWHTTNTADTSFSGNELTTQTISAPSSTTVTAAYSGVTGTLAVPLSGPLTMTGPTGGTSSLTGTVGTTYTYSFSVAGGSGGYSWHIIDPSTQVATTNPDVSLSATSGGTLTVTYTPSAVDYTTNNPSGSSGRPDEFIVEATDTATNQSLNQDVDVTLNRQTQNLSWVQTLPTTGTYGSSLFLSGTSSAGLQTAISAVGDGDGCTVSGGQVSFNVSFNGVCQIQLSQAGSGTFAPATITATIDVAVPSGFAWAASQPPPGQGQVANTQGLFWAEPNNSNPQDPGAVSYSIDPATTNNACHVAQTTAFGVFVQWDSIGSCVVDATIAAASNSDGFTFPAATVQSVVPVVGQTSFLRFQSAAPSGEAVGRSYTPTFQTMVGGINDPSQTISPATPRVTIDTADSTPSNACATDGTTVTFTHAGTCVIGADQPATSQFSQINALSGQTIAVGPGTQAITFPGPIASSYIPGSSTTLTPTGGASGSAVTLSVDSASTDTANPGSPPCSVDGDTVSFTDAGTCVIDANQASTADYAQAPQVKKTFTIQNGQIALISPGLVCSAHDGAGNCTGTYQPPALTATASNDPQTQVLVALENAAGSPTSATGDVTVTLTGDGHPEFQDAAGDTITHITIPANSFYTVAYYGNTQAGTQSISATAALPNPSQTQISSGPASVAVTAGPIASLQWEIEPTDGNVGQAMGQFALEAVDAYGNAVSGAAVTLTATNLATGQSQAIAQGATGTTANNPNAGDPADFGGVVFDQAGTYELTASAGGVSSVGPSQAFTIAPGPVTTLRFTTEPANAASGQPMPQIKVAALDSHNDPVPNASVTLSVNNGGQITGNSGQTGADGVATFDTTTVSPVGSYTMTATSGGVTQLSTVFHITQPTSLASLIWRSQPSNVTAGAPMSPLSVEADDTSGSPLLAVPVKLTATNVATGQTVTIDQDSLESTVSDATHGDLATFGNFTIDQAGTYRLTATSGGISSTSSQQFTVAAGAVSSVSFASQPTAGSAGVPISGVSVQANDGFGNPVIGAPVTLTATDAGSGHAVTINTDSSELTVSDPTDGDLATFENLTIDALGTDLLTATSNGQSATSSPFTISTGPVGQLTFIGEPSDVVAGHQMSVVSVQAADAGGNPVTGADVTLTATNINTGQTVTAGSDGTETTFSDPTYGDLASFYQLTIDTGGTYTLTASSNGVSVTSTQVFTVSVDTVDSLMFASNLNSVVAGQAISPVQVQALNGSGQRVIGAPITITATNVTSGQPETVSGDSTENTAQQNQYGDLATFSNLTLDHVGTYTLTATSDGVSLTSTQQLTVTPAAVSRLRFTEPPTDSIAGEAIPEVQVLATDQYTNPVPNATVTLSVDHGASVTGVINPSENTAQTDQFGDATFDDATVDTTGTYTMTATSGSASANSPSPFTVSVDPVGSLMFATKPTDAVAGQPITPAVQVQALDAANLTDVGAPITLTATNVVSGHTVTIDQDATENTVAEMPYGDLATFSNLTINTPGTYQLTASSGGVSLQDDRQFTVAAGAISHLTFSAQPTDTTAGAILPRLKVLATDSLGNPIPNADVTLSVNHGGAVINDTATTGSDGYATFDSATIDQAGTYTLTASSSDVSIASTSTFTVSAGAVNALGFITEPAGAVTGQTLPAIKIEATDSVGNPVPDASVTLSVDGGGQITGAGETTGDDGTAIFDDVTISPAGTYTLTATSGGISKASDQVTISPVVVPPVSTALTIAATPSPVVYGKAIKVTGTLTAAGHALPGQTVALLYRKAGSTGAYSRFGTTAKSGATGAVSITTFTPTTPVQVELSYAGSSSGASAYDSATSPTKTVAQERVVTITAPKSAAKGKTAAFTGAVTPKQTGLTVYLQRKSGTSWKAVGTAKLTAAGKYSIKLKLATKGTFTYRVLVKTSSGFSQSVSATKSIKVK